MTQTAHLRTAALALALGLAGCTTPRTPYEAPAVAVPTQWPHTQASAAAIGSGGAYALSAARALLRHSDELDAESVVRAAMGIAAEICVYTNDNLTVETLAG